MKIKLKDVCTFRSGFQGKSSEGKLIKQIKLKDVTSDGEILLDQLSEISCGQPIDRYELYKNNILFKAKSTENTAACVPCDLKETVANSHFFVITVKDEEVVDPMYLTIYLNSELAQGYFKKHSQGVTSSMVRLKTLEEMEVLLPSINKQREAIKAYHLMKSERELMEKLIQNREKQFKGYFQGLLEEA